MEAARPEIPVLAKVDDLTPANTVVVPDDAEEPSSLKKRIRKSRSRGLRTKTGCLTCRKRHKKCDEQLPTCGPCSISSRECLYPTEQKPSPAGRARLVRDAQPPAPKSSDESATSSASPASLLPPAVPTASATSNTAVGPVAAPTPRTLYSSPGDRPPSHVGHGDGYQVGFSPETVASELLSADMASTRWLDLLATDAAQADSAFSLAPSPAPVSDDTTEGYDQAQPVSAASLIADPTPAPETRSWQSDRDIVLQHHEAVLFRVFADRAALWLDIFDPFRHFSTYAIRLALRNVGLMKAILALTARHSAIVQERKSGPASAPSEAVQYYYETLHYVSQALQYNTYAHSEELLATAIVISTYEMLDESDSNWKRHLKGVFWIQRGQDVDGASGGIRQSVWWAWLRQDIWAAFRERRKCFSFWKPIVDYPDLNQDEIADRAVYLLSQTVNYCANVTPESATPEKRAADAEVLLAKLERWRTFLGPPFKPLPTPASATDVFQPLWMHPPRYGVALQVYSFARILLTLHGPVVSGFDGYMRTQKTLSESVATICGIAMELRDEGSQILSAQCLFGAGLCVQDEVKRKAIIGLIDACEARTAWPMTTMKNDLMAEWAKVS